MNSVRLFIAEQLYKQRFGRALALARRRQSELDARQGSLSDEEYQLQRIRIYVDLGRVANEHWKSMDSRERSDGAKDQENSPDTPISRAFLAIHADGENILELLASPIRKRERDELLGDLIDSMNDARQASLGKPWGRIAVLYCFICCVAIIIGNVSTQIIGSFLPKFHR